MTDDQSLLTSAHKAVARWQFTAWPNGGANIPRDGPTQGFWTRDSNQRERGPYVFACKSNLYENVYASFSTTLIAAARPLADHPRKLVLFVGERPHGRPYSIEDAWVFDPRRVVNQATDRERTHVDSKRERDVPIYDVACAANGIGLGDYLSGRRSLPGPTDERWRAATLGLFQGGAVA